MENLTSHRRQFLRNSSIIAGGAALMPSTALSSILTPPPPHILFRVIGYLVPILIGETVKTLFEQYRKREDKSSVAVTVNQSIQYISNGNYPVSQSYRQDYANIRLNTTEANGKGFRVVDREIKERISDDRKVGTTPVHSVREINSFDHESWSHHCDLADVQSVHDGIYVTPRDNRDSSMQGCFFVPTVNLDIIYLPEYYCKGLPTQDPHIERIQHHELAEMLAWAKARGDNSLVSRINNNQINTRYMSQRFCYTGGHCGNPKMDYTTVVWDFDEAYGQFKKFPPLGVCGAPSCTPHLR